MLRHCSELPEATRVLVGCTGTLYWSYCSWYFYNLADWDWRVDPIDWGRCPSMDGAHYEHDTLISRQFLITNLGLLLCECIWTGTLGHIPRHPSRTSLNNNNRHTNDLIPILIIILLTWPDPTTLILSNSGCIAQLMVEWGIWYIQEGLLVWIISLMYWSHGARDWVYTISFAYLYIMYMQLMNYICFHWYDLNMISCINKYVFT